MNRENFACPSHLVKVVEWITPNANMIPNWERMAFHSLGYNIERISRYFVSIVLDTTDPNLRTALYLISLGRIDKVPENYMEQAIATGLVSPINKCMYAFAQPWFAVHAEIWIDNEGNNRDFNGNLV